MYLDSEVNDECIGFIIMRFSCSYPKILLEGELNTYNSCKSVFLCFFRFIIIIIVKQNNNPKTMEENQLPCDGYYMTDC